MRGTWTVSGYLRGTQRQRGHRRSESHAWYSALKSSAAEQLSGREGVLDTSPALEFMSGVLQNERRMRQGSKTRTVRPV